jgi:hypothetical protein
MNHGFRTIVAIRGGAFGAPPRGDLEVFATPAAGPRRHGGRPAHRVNLTSTTTFLPLSAMGTRVKERMIGTGFGLIGIPSPGPAA